MFHEMEDEQSEISNKYHIEKEKLISEVGNK